MTVHTTVFSFFSHSFIHWNLISILLPVAYPWYCHFPLSFQHRAFPAHTVTVGLYPIAAFHWTWSSCRTRLRTAPGFQCQLTTFFKTSISPTFVPCAKMTVPTWSYNSKWSQALCLKKSCYFPLVEKTSAFILINKFQRESEIMVKELRRGWDE